MEDEYGVVWQVKRNRCSCSSSVTDSSFLQLHLHRKNRVEGVVVTWQVETTIQQLLPSYQFCARLLARAIHAGEEEDTAFISRATRMHL